MTGVPHLLQSLALTQTHAGTFRAERSLGIGGPRLFGGQVVAQALFAAYGTVTDRLCHSLHAYFIRPGDPVMPIDFEVECVRDGTSFATRRVVARQGGQQILNLSASFQVPEDGPSHQVPQPPAVPSATAIPERAFGSPPAAGSANAGNRSVLQQLVEIRQVNPRSSEDPGVAPPNKALWLRVSSVDRQPQAAQQVALAFASDLVLLETAMRPHGLIWTTPGLQSASIDHAVWFHRPVDFSQWHLFSHDSPTAHGARGFVKAQVFAQDGTLVASIAQEGLMRLRKRT